MTKTEATNLHRELDSAIRNILGKYNLTLKSNSLRFGEREIKWNLSMEQLNTDGSHKADDYTENMLRYEFSTSGVKNIPSKIVGSKIKSFSGETFIITGYNRRAQKYPVEAQRVSDGQMFKMMGRGVQFI